MVSKKTNRRKTVKNTDAAVTGKASKNATVTVKAKAGYSAAEVRQAVSAAFVSCVGSTPAGGKMYRGYARSARLMPYA